MKKYDLEKKIRVGMYIIINKKCWQIKRINVLKETDLVMLYENKN